MLVPRSVYSSVSSVVDNPAGSRAPDEQYRTDRGDHKRSADYAYCPTEKNDFTAPQLADRTDVAPGAWRVAMMK